MHPVFGWTLGWPELLILGFVVLLLFGNRLPSVMRSLGLGVTEFKKGMQGIEDQSNEQKSSGSKPAE
jgi:sec-independent protein translocase protein TatA